MKRLWAVALLLGSLLVGALWLPGLLHSWRVQQALYALSETNPEDDLALAARQDLLDLGEQAIDPLLQEMGRKVCPLRRQLATILRAIDGPEAARRVRPGLSDPDPKERRQALQLLGVLEEKTAAPWVLPLLEDSDPEVYREAVVTLSFLESADAVPRLRHYLSQGNAVRRAWSAYGLGYLQDQDSVSLLQRAVELDADPAVRFQAERALQRLGVLAGEPDEEDSSTPALQPER